MEQQALAKQDKLVARQIDIIPTLVRQDADETKKLAKLEALRIKQLKEEKDRQEKLGEVTKPAVVGRFKYKMRKTDFQLEEELAPSLRQLKV